MHRPKGNMVEKCITQKRCFGRQPFDSLKRRLWITFKALRKAEQAGTQAEKSKRLAQKRESTETRIEEGRNARERKGKRRKTAAAERKSGEGINKREKACSGGVKKREDRPGKFAGARSRKNSEARRGQRGSSAEKAVNRRSRSRPNLFFQPFKRGRRKRSGRPRNLPFLI